MMKLGNACYTVSVEKKEVSNEKKSSADAMFLQQYAYIKIENKQRMAETVTHLIEGLKQQSPKAQQEALELYGRNVWVQVVRIVSCTEDAEEVYQDVFVKAFNNINRYDGEKASLKTWLLRIAYNEAVSFLRSRKATIISLDDYGNHTDNISEEEAEKIIGRPDNESILTLRSAIQHLTPEEQALITMFYYDGLSLNDIAFVTKSTPSTVGSRLSRTRKKLCTIIKRIQS